MYIFNMGKFLLNMVIVLIEIVVQGLEWVVMEWRTEFSYIPKGWGHCPLCSVLLVNQWWRVYFMYLNLYICIII